MKTLLRAVKQSVFAAGVLLFCGFGDPKIKKIASYGKCTGSMSCTACKNCSACKHCSQQGGSCGVCYSERTEPEEKVIKPKPSTPKKVEPARKLTPRTYRIDKPVSRKTQN